MVAIPLLSDQLVGGGYETTVAARNCATHIVSRRWQLDEISLAYAGGIGGDSLIFMEAFVKDCWGGFSIRSTRPHTPFTMSATHRSLLAAPAVLLSS